jgi:nitrogen regulatory protein PII
MKNIIAIIRNECIRPSRSALEYLGIHDIAELPASGESGPVCSVPYACPDPEIFPDGKSPPHVSRPGADIPSSASSGYIAETVPKPEFLPRTMLIAGAIEDLVLPAVQALIRISQAESDCDCEIFVCPMVTAFAIGTGDDDDPEMS